jgi:hypothetical protein
MTEPRNDDSTSPDPTEDGAGPAEGASANGSALTDASNNGVNGSSHALDDDSPEDIGSELMHRLDTLDDRLQRSQEKMIALLDRKLGDAGGPAPTRAGEGAADPEQARWAAPSPSAPSPFEAPETADPDDPMETWFNAAPPKAGANFLTATDAPSKAVTPIPAGETPTANVPRVSALRAPPLETPEPEPHDPGAQASEATPPVGTQLTPDQTPEATPAPMPEIVPSHRPAWQSNLMTVVVAAIVIVVALFLVGLF